MTVVTMIEKKDLLTKSVKVVNRYNKQMMFLVSVNNSCVVYGIVLLLDFLKLYKYQDQSKYRNHVFILLLFKWFNFIEFGLSYGFFLFFLFFYFLCCIFIIY